MSDIDERLLPYVQKHRPIHRRRGQSDTQGPFGVRPYGRPVLPGHLRSAMSNTGLGIVYEVLKPHRWRRSRENLCPVARCRGGHAEKRDTALLVGVEGCRSRLRCPRLQPDHELCYTNVLNMLDLAGLKVRSAERSDSDPIVIAGGGMANCCEPLATSWTFLSWAKARKHPWNLSGCSKRQRPWQGQERNAP